MGDVRSALGALPVVQRSAQATQAKEDRVSERKTITALARLASAPSGITRPVRVAPTIGTMLADITSRAGFLHLNCERRFDGMTFSAWVSGRNGQLSMDGDSPARAIYRLWRALGFGGGA